MAEQKAKGSLIYEALIVILAALLVASIVYPKKLSDQEIANTNLCRDRMSSIFDAELQYLRYNAKFNDTLEVVFDFLRNDPRYIHYIDSVIVGNLDSAITKLEEFKNTEEMILTNIPNATDSAMIDSLGTLQQNIKMESRRLAGLVEVVHDKMKNLPNMPISKLREAFLIVDSKKFTLDMDIVKNSIDNGRLQDAQLAANQVIQTINSVVDAFNDVKARIPEYKGPALDSLNSCPTVQRPYQVVHIDTSAIKYLNIYCPIDSPDIQMVEANFLKSKFGGLKIRYHGGFEAGEKVLGVSIASIRLKPKKEEDALQLGLQEGFREEDFTKKVLDFIGRTEFKSKYELATYFDQKVNTVAQSDSIAAATLAAYKVPVLNVANVTTWGDSQ